MSFGLMPIANGFISPDKVDSDTYRYELQVASCAGCRAFQLIDQPPPDLMFHERYAFFSQTSRVMEHHFQTFADTACVRWIANRADAFVVELGSNDGIMLRHFAARGLRHLGIEPSANVAAVAKAQGLQTLCAFFDAATAVRIRDEHGLADLVVAANVMCHIGSIRGVAEGLAILLKDDGVLMFEDPYLGDVIAKTSYDQIYDEHVFLFNLMTVRALFGGVGLEVIDVCPLQTHGGSMRYVLARAGRYEIAASVAALAEREDSQGLADDSTYTKFKASCEKSRSALVKILNELKAKGQRVAGYGATSKGTTVLNYCGIGPDQIGFISDTTPIKQGKLTPGSHIPVRPPEEFARHYPDFAVLFAWNHKFEILEKERDFLASGGRFITFVPDVHIIGSGE